MKSRISIPGLGGLAVLMALVLVVPLDAQASEEDTYDQETVLEAAENFFGETTEGLAKVVQKVFEDHGRPNGYIAGEEVSGAIGLGVRYGEGTLQTKSGGAHQVFWQGPSVGFDLGGNASKVFVLTYHLDNSSALFQRFPAAEGSIYFVAGVGVNYQQSGDIILAPIRTGVGLRAGVNIGYMHYTAEHSWLPL